MLNFGGIFHSEFRWNRLSRLFAVAGIIWLLVGALNGPKCAAQSEDQETNTTKSQQLGQVPDSSTELPTAQSQSSQDQNQNDSPNATPNRPAVQLQKQPSIVPPPMEPKKPKASAEQIISVLGHRPEILKIIKNRLAETNKLDADSISDESVYEDIRQDASMRESVTQLLISSGLSADLEALNPDLVSPGTIQPYVDPNNPQVERRYSPYKNMPSMADLYSRFSTPATTLRRFGSDAFMVGTAGANQIPMDLPAGPDYVLGPGDYLTLNLWGGLSTRLKRTIDRQGQISLPEAGSVMLNSLTITQAQNEIQKALDTQFHGEHVEISLERLRTVRVYVVGDVQRPGAYDVSSLSTLLGALYAAGGPTSRGSLRSLQQLRGGKLVHQIDLYDFLLKGVRSSDDRLLPGDTVLVPPVGPQVTVDGAVRRPAVYELNGEERLDQVLDIAGGLLASASLQQIEIERISAHQGRTMLSLQLNDIQDEAKKQISSFNVHDGDIINIKQILPYNSQAVYLEGHVYHPGKYSYREGMTLNDILRSYQDLMPEPADHAEIVRLRPPDFRPTTISINLPDVLMGNQSILLQPLDMIRIYGRYETDSPMVEIKGEVLRPGKYPLSRGMTASELVNMAGGFRISAFREVSEITSYVIKDGKNVEVEHSDINIQKALDGDKNADALLKAGDVLGIRRIAGWQDIGANMTIGGEVEHPGSYGIQEGERLSSVLKRAGGFRREAYPYAARFERAQVRELNEQARLQLIRRIQDTPVSASHGAPNQGGSAVEEQKALESQRQQLLSNLTSRTASGRMVVNISSDITKWENTPADIQLRAGDTLVIPKRADFVSINGQVYNPVAVSYVPGKKLGWYFKKSGGATSTGNKKHMYLLRADGSVVPRRSSLFGGGFMDLRIRPGDSIIVPEKFVGSSQIWQNLETSANIVSGLMLPLAVTGVL